MRHILQHHIINPEFGTFLASSRYIKWIKQNTASIVSTFFLSPYKNTVCIYRPFNHVFFLESCSVLGRILVSFIISREWREEEDVPILWSLKCELSPCEITLYTPTNCTSVNYSLPDYLVIWIKFVQLSQS